MENNNILVCGNGFDIAHGLKTRYSDFIKYTQDNGIGNDNPFIMYFRARLKLSNTRNIPDEEKKWIDCEAEISQVIKTFKKLTDKIESFDGEMRKKTFYNLNTTDEYLLLYFEEYFEYDDTQYYGRINEKYLNFADYYEKKEIIDDLKKDLQEAIEILEDYLEKNCDYKKCEPILKNKKFDAVVNFNYTRTYEKYIDNRHHVFDIHGTLGNSPNNMVLGIDDEKESYNDYVAFSKYFQRIEKDTSILDMNNTITTKPDKEGITRRKTKVAHFYGHSMSNTDGDILRKIIQSVQYSYIYYHSMQDKSEKLENIINVLGKEDVVNKRNKKTLMFFHTSELERNIK